MVPVLSVRQQAKSQAVLSCKSVQSCCGSLLHCGEPKLHQSWVPVIVPSPGHTSTALLPFHHTHSHTHTWRLLKHPSAPSLLLKSPFSICLPHTNFQPCLFFFRTRSSQPLPSFLQSNRLSRLSSIYLSQYHHSRRTTCDTAHKITSSKPPSKMKTATVFASTMALLGAVAAQDFNSLPQCGVS